MGFYEIPALKNKSYKYFPQPFYQLSQSAPFSEATTLSTTWHYIPTLNPRTLSFHGYTKPQLAVYITREDISSDILHVW